jgi:hypothetical protein
MGKPVAITSGWNKINRCGSTLGGSDMKSEKEEEKENFEILLKAAGDDPKALAAIVKEILLADKTIKAPPKEVNEKEKAMLDAAKDILKMGKRPKL